MTQAPRPGKAVSIPTNRLTRLARMGAMTAGVAGNMAMESLSELGLGRKPSWRNVLLTPANLHRVTRELARMRGAAMKLGQLLSMDTGDVLPPELAEIMARLRADADFMPPAQLKKVLNANWPQGWLKHFAHFDVRPIAAASIGQVHRATLKDGRDLAIKVQYPGVARSIDSDVANVASLIRMTGLVPKGFDIAPYIDEARQQLHAETDYRAEARHLKQFGDLLEDMPDFTLPAPQDDWSTDTILAMSYVPSVSLDDVMALPQDLRNTIATRLFDLLLHEVFDFGLVQTDPNLANFRYQPDTDRIVLLDFGATRAPDPVIVAQYRGLIRAGLSKDARAMTHHAQALGLFDDTTRSEHVDRLMAMMGKVFAAITGSKLYDFGDQSLTRALNTEAMDLATSGFVPPPAPIDVLFLQRKFAGIFLIAAQLGAVVPLQAKLLAHLCSA